MIVVLDNGMGYSDHSIYFIETNLAPEEISRIYNAQGRYSYGDAASVVFVAEKVEWRDGEPCKFGEVIYAHNFVDYSGGGGRPTVVKGVTRGFDALSKEALAELLPVWESGVHPSNRPDLRVEAIKAEAVKRGWL